MKLEPISRPETIRYLRYGNHTPDDNITKMIDECENILRNEIRAVYVYKIFDKEITPDGNIKPAGTNIIFYGNDIQNLLSECSKIVMLCATLTDKADRIIRTAGITDKTKALIYDALSCAAIEQVCDRVCELIDIENPGYFLTKRFSPGYGDFPLETQQAFLNVLDAQKRTGVALNSGNLMTPMKTVTAVCGLSETELPQKKAGCSSCFQNKNCEYRKVGETCGY